MNSVRLTIAVARIPRPRDGALRQASPRRTRSTLTIDDNSDDPATTGNRIVSTPAESLALAYAKATPPPARRRTKGANHQALRCCVWVDIVEVTMMAQRGVGLHHPAEGQAEM